MGKSSLVPGTVRLLATDYRCVFGLAEACSCSGSLLEAPSHACCAQPHLQLSHSWDSLRPAAGQGMRQTDSQSGFLDVASGTAEVGARGRDCCFTLVWHPRSASQSRGACPRSPLPVSRLCFGSQLDTGIQTRVAFVIYSPVFSFHRA